MRSVEEVAEAVVKAYFGNENTKALYQFILNALNAFAEERVNEALEEAAKVCGTFECTIASGSEVCNCDLEIATKIRTLKHGVKPEGSV